MAITPITSIAPVVAPAGMAPPPTSAGGGLGQAFTDLLSRLSQTEQSTNDLVTRAAADDDVDVHDVMIATQAESLAFQVGLQVRNKLVDAYQEIFRMQV